MKNYVHNVVEILSIDYCFFSVVCCWAVLLLFADEAPDPDPVTLLPPSPNGFGNPNSSFLSTHFFFLSFPSLKLCLFFLIYSFRRQASNCLWYSSHAPPTIRERKFTRAKQSWRALAGGSQRSGRVIWWLDWLVLFFWVGIWRCERGSFVFWCVFL